MISFRNISFFSIFISLISLSCELSERPEEASQQIVSEESVAARAKVIDENRKIQDEHFSEFGTMLDSLVTFRDIAFGTAAPISDTLQSIPERRSQSLTYKDSESRTFLSLWTDSTFYPYLRSAVSGDMLRHSKMLGGSDSLNVFYLEHAVKGFTPDIDLIIQTLNSIRRPTPQVVVIAEEALLNLFAYEFLLTAWQESYPELSDAVVFTSSDRVTTAAFLEEVEDNANSIVIFLASY